MGRCGGEGLEAQEWETEVQEFGMRTGIDAHSYKIGAHFWNQKYTAPFNLEVVKIDNLHRSFIVMVWKFSIGIWVPENEQCGDRNEYTPLSSPPAVKPDCSHGTTALACLQLPFSSRHCHVAGPHLRGQSLD